MSGIAAWFRARSSADARTASAPVERRMKKTTAAKKAPAKKAAKKPAAKKATPKTKKKAEESA
jgi:hypothetical protein